MTPEARPAAAGLGCSVRATVKIGERIKSLFRREPPTAEEIAARAEAVESLGADQIHQDDPALKNQVPGRIPGSDRPF